MNTVDLHTHSLASIDGEFEAEQLIDLAVNFGLEYYAIADHDSIDSLKTAKDYADDKNITFIPAIEISVDMDGTPLHILGYNIDFEDQKYIARAKLYKEGVINYGRELIQKTLDFGFKFDPEIAYNSRSDHLVCEEIIAETILRDSRNDDDERLRRFRPGASLSDNPGFNFYKHFCSPGKPLHVPYSFNMPVIEASELIHSTGGKMFLAHPAHNIGHDIDLLNKIMSCGLDGIEVFSSYHKKQDTEHYYKVAKQNGLYMSVGSDFHGKAKPAIKLASIDYDEDELDKTVRFILC